MKHYIQLCLLGFALLFTQFSYGKKHEDYWVNLNNEIEVFQQISLEYLNAVMPYRGAILSDYKRTESIYRINVLKDTLSKNFDNLSYRDSLIIVLNDFKKVLKDQLDHLKYTEILANRSFSEMQNYLSLKLIIAKKLVNLVGTTNQIRARFIAKYGIDYNVNQILNIQSRMMRTKDVYSHYFKVYELFFSVNSTETNLIMAIANKSLDQMSLFNSIMEGEGLKSIEQLKLVNGFEGDTALLQGCEQILAFYVYESQSEIPDIIEYVKEEKAFNILKKDFEEKDSLTITKKDRESFEKSELQFQKATENYLVIIERTNLLEATD